MFKYVTTLFKVDDCRSCPFVSDHDFNKAKCTFYDKPLMGEKEKIFIGAPSYCDITDVTVQEEK